MERSEQRNNSIIGFGFILFAALLIFELQGLKWTTKVMPFIIANGIGGIGVLLNIQVLFLKLKGSAKESASQVEEKQASDQRNREKALLFDYIGSFLSLFFAYILIDILGFYTAVTIYSIFIFLFYSKNWKLTDFRNSIIFGFILMISLYLIFNMLMGLHTPAGLFI